MLTIENVVPPSASQMMAIVRGMRNPHESYDRNDSDSNIYGYFELGENDRDLMMRLMTAGPEHRKFLRMMHVILDIDAPLYWWKQFDTYKVGVNCNSTSTMHSITKKELEIGDFTRGIMISAHAFSDLQQTIVELNRLIKFYNQADKIFDKEMYWNSIIVMLPESYHQKRTVQISYETLFNIYEQRQGHKLKEWRDFCNWITDGCPYGYLIKTAHSRIHDKLTRQEIIQQLQTHMGKDIGYLGNNIIEELIESFDI